MNFFKKYKYWLIILLVIVVVIAIDLITKSIFEGKEFTIINGILSIYSISNPGGAWGILSDSTDFLIILSIVILFILVWINIQLKEKTTFYSIGMGLIVGGAVGNLIDRFAFHQVRDFIKLDFLNFPIFNFADICLTVGAIFMIIYFLFLYKSQAQKPKS